MRRYPYRVRVRAMSRIRCFNATGSTLRDWYIQVDRGNRTTSQARLALTPKHSIIQRASSLNRAGLKAFFESPPATCDGPDSSPLPSASDDGSHPPAPSTGVPPKAPIPRTSSSTCKMSAPKSPTCGSLPLHASRPHAGAARRRSAPR